MARAVHGLQGALRSLPGVELVIPDPAPILVSTELWAGCPLPALAQSVQLRYRNDRWLSRCFCDSACRSSKPTLWCAASRPQTPATTIASPEARGLFPCCLEPKSFRQAQKSRRKPPLPPSQSCVADAVRLCTGSLGLASQAEDTVPTNEEDDEVDADQHARKGRAPVGHDPIVHD